MRLLPSSRFSTKLSEWVLQNTNQFFLLICSQPCYLSLFPILLWTRVMFLSWPYKHTHIPTLPPLQFLPSYVSPSILFSYQAYRHRDLCNRCPFVLDFSFSRKLQDQLTYLQAVGHMSLFPEVFHPVSNITAPYVPSILLCFIPPPSTFPTWHMTYPLILFIVYSFTGKPVLWGQEFLSDSHLIFSQLQHCASPRHSGNICWTNQLMYKIL